MITIGLLVLVMLKIELPTMVPGYPLKLTPKTPVRPLPLMVTTAPGSAPVGPVILVGTMVPLVDREGERVQGVVLRRRPGPHRTGLESDESRVPGPGAGVGGDGGAVSVAGRPVEFTRSKEAGVLVVFAMTFVTSHRPLMAESFTPLIVTTSPMARVPVSAVVIVIGAARVVGNAGDRCTHLRKRTDVNHRSSCGQEARAGDKGSGSVRMLRVATGSGQPRDGRLIKPGDRGKAGSQVACIAVGEVVSMYPWLCWVPHGAIGLKISGFASTFGPLKGAAGVAAV